MLEALQALNQVAWGEVTQYRYRSPIGPGFDPDYWENAAENAVKVQNAVNIVLRTIRDRIRLWEEFDPGP